jgi:predicted Fe-S protein YdhL (DUF1289 family)
MEEIARWSSLGSRQRQNVLDRLEDRKARIQDRERRAAAFRLPGS